MKKISVFVQMILIIFVISAIPAITVILINSSEMRKNSETYVAESTVDELQANKRLSDEMFTIIIYNALDFIREKRYEELNGVLSFKELNSEYDYVSAAMKMKDSISFMCERNELVHSAFYYLDGSDYVISTNNGIVTLDQYESMDWMNEAVTGIKGGEGVWCPRSMTQTTASSESKLDVVSFLYRSNNLNSSTKGIIVINVYEEKLAALIQSEKNEQISSGIMMNETGSVIAATDTKLLYQDIKNLEYVEKALQSEEKGGYGISEDKTMLYTYERSDLYDWIYINTYSMEEMSAQTRRIVITGIMMSLLILLAVAVCAIIASMFFSKPIRRLVDEINTFNTEPEEGINRNELTYLIGAIGKIKEREQNLQERLTEKETAARWAVIQNLIHGEHLLKKERELLENYFIWHHFIVCFMVTDKFTGYEKSTTHEQRKAHRTFIHNFIQNIFPSEYIVDSVRYDIPNIVLIINLKDYDSAKVKKIMDASLGELQAAYKRETSWELSIGVSQVHSQFDGVALCVEEAYEALKRRLQLGKGRIIFYQQPDERQIETYNSFLHEKRIMNFIETGDMHKLKEELALMAENLKKMTSISVENIMLVFNQLIGATMMYLNRNNYNAGMILGGMESNLYEVILEKETIDESIEYLESVYEKIIDYQNLESGMDSHDYVRELLDELKRNYRKDIDFEEISDKLGVSYSYLRKIVKNKTGKSLIDNMNQIRIEEVKRQLEQTDYPLSKIALMVGYNNVQSLNRFFKKYEGIAPNEYKISLQKNND